MHVKFLFFTNAVFVFANNALWSNHHHQLYADNPQQILHSKNNSKHIMKGNNKLHKLRRDKPVIDHHMKKQEEETILPWNLSKESDRLHFHIQGHEGPQTYIFGFDTGYGKSRQYRLEERHRDGTIKGQYGYYDARGKLRTIRYIAKPFGGYTEIHHESNIRKLIS
ncbi:uncharacterized protein LOC117603112 [Osmia lignaria lignaria]|uniref:uncharacterized protein LOC117603112 n=1 Tax=Osmia lignaria lignaria TaxID=1437193 RepID=UPI0014794840|nr:uncharacterized protein LOC117603112 [Osmia lignaria]